VLLTIQVFRYLKLARGMEKHIAGMNERIANETNPATLKGYPAHSRTTCSLSERPHTVA
jgi:hypothetical protein